MSSVAVSMTTDQTGTRALERAGVDVQWMSCTSTVGEGGRISKDTASPTRSARSVATVKCEGETKSGQEIRIDGKVTEERDGRCVRGDLTAKVGNRTVFQADVLGNCAAAPPTTRNPTPPVTYEPTRTTSPPSTTPRPPSDRPRATVTVTTTVTADPEPTCDCPQTK